MGCDIHVHVEAKISGTWHHWSHVSVDRCYALFEHLAGVRGDDKNQKYPVRGLPDDLNHLTKMDWDLMRGDGHTPSWITGQEADAVNAWFRETMSGYQSVFGYLLGCSLGDKQEGIDDVRVVFWFDN